MTNAAAEALKAIIRAAEVEQMRVPAAMTDVHEFIEQIIGLAEHGLVDATHE